MLTRKKGRLTRGKQETQGKTRKAQEKCNFIDKNTHLLLESAHPSPFSANNGFFGSKPFSKTNNYLIQKNIEPIDWQL